jgi:hypothetical protein
MCARERLRVPELWLAGLVADCAEDVEGDAADGMRLPLASRARTRKDDSREELDPVGPELAVV